MSTDPAKEKPEDTWSGLRSILAHLWRHRRAYGLGVLVLAIVDAIDSVAQPWLQGAAFAKLERGDALAWSFAAIGGAYAFSAVIQMGLRYLWRHYFIKTADVIGGEVRSSLFQRLQRLPFSYYDRARSGDLMSRMTNDLNDVRTAAGVGTLVLADMLLYMSCVLPQLIWISWKLSTTILLALAVSAFVVNLLRRSVHTRGVEASTRLGALSARIQESFSGIRVVKAFSQEEREVERIDELARSYLEGTMSLVRVQAAFGPMLNAVFDSALLAVLLIGGAGVVSGEMSLAAFVVYTRALDKIVWPMTAIGWVVSILQRGAAAHSRIDEVLREADDPIFSAPAPDDGAPVRGGVSVRGLTFAYDRSTRKALEDVSFEAPAGAFVALVGPVGSGKSTLLSLLARLYPPPRGTIFLDDRDILDVAPVALRRSVAVVPQDTFLFSATIEENVALGRSRDLRREDVEEAARAARVDEEIRALPGGYEALLGERGVNLSGGQRQRVAIARALARAPRVLLLDDALSAVDTETEAAIAREVRDRRGKPTRIVATHRLSAVRNADAILVLDHGKIVESGRHDELMARGGLYSRLARRETLEEEIARA